MFSDLRQAFRTLTASKGFSLLIVGVLAVGISANAAMFSIVNGVLPKPLPLADPQRLVSVETTVRGEPDGHVVSRLPRLAGADVQLRRAGGVRIKLARRSPASAKRNHSRRSSSAPSSCRCSAWRRCAAASSPPDDDKPGAPRTAIIAESVWEKHFNRDENIIGRPVTFEGDPFHHRRRHAGELRVPLRHRRADAGLECRSVRRVSPPIGPSSGTRRFCTASAA